MYFLRGFDMIACSILDSPHDICLSTVQLFDLFPRKYIVCDDKSLLHCSCKKIPLGLLWLSYIAKKSSIELAKTWWIAQRRRRTYSPPPPSSSRSGLYWRPHQNFTSVAHCAAIWMWTSPRRESLTADAIRLDPIWKISTSEHFRLELENMYLL